MFRPLLTRLATTEIPTFASNVIASHAGVPCASAVLPSVYSRRQISVSTQLNAALTSDPPSSPAAKPPHVHHVHEKRNVTAIPGDGVGPEMLYSVAQIFKATDAPVIFEEFNISEVSFSRAGNLQDAVESVKKNRVCLKGVLAAGFESPGGELENVNTKLKRRLDLFASVVYIQTLEGLKGKHQNLDLRIIRETTEGEYSALEHAIVPGVIECLKVVTRKNSIRIAKFAFDYAMKYKRKQVTAVHKANIMKLGDGLFLESCGEVAKLYPKIKYDNMIIDNFCMQIVSNPQQFDICVMPNLYGNIVDNLAAGLVGGAGVVPGESVAHDCIVFEPGARHSYAEAVGKNIANPTAMIRASCNMLRHINLFYHARIIESALMQVLKTGKTRTKDMGGYATTTQFTRAVIDNIKF